MSSTCCPQGSTQHSPWTSYAPFVWNALFHVPPPTFIRPMNPPSAFRTAQASHLLCVKPFLASQSSFLCVRAHVPQAGSSHSAHCTEVHLFSRPSPERSMRTGNESCLSLNPQCLSCGLAPSRYCKNIFWLNFYYVKYLATSFYFNPIKTSRVPTLCQVLCTEIGYISCLWRTETVIPQVITVVMEGYAGGCGSTVGVREHDAQAES